MICHYRGFTLLELLLVMSLLAILMVLALPNYQMHFVRIRRLEGKIALLEMANQLETYHAKHHRYDTATVAALSHQPLIDYQLIFLKQSAQSYQLAAIPTGTQATADRQCQTLTLSDQGVRSISAGPVGQPTASAISCWS